MVRFNITQEDDFKFKAVVENNKETNNSKKYIKFSKSRQIDLTSKKKEASSLKTLNRYIKSVKQNETLSIEKKEIILNSFESFTNSIQSRNTKCQKIFFFLLILKKHQIKIARKEIADFRNLLAASRAINPPAPTPVLPKHPQPAIPTTPAQSAKPIVNNQPQPAVRPVLPQGPKVEKPVLPYSNPSKPVDKKKSSDVPLPEVVLTQPEKPQPISNPAEQGGVADDKPTTTDEQVADDKPTTTDEQVAEDKPATADGQKAPEEKSPTKTEPVPVKMDQNPVQEGPVFLELELPFIVNNWVKDADEAFTRLKNMPMGAFLTWKDQKGEFKLLCKKSENPSVDDITTFSPENFIQILRNQLNDEFLSLNRRAFFSREECLKYFENNGEIGEFVFCEIPGFELVLKMAPSSVAIFNSSDIDRYSLLNHKRYPLFEEVLAMDLTCFSLSDYSYFKTQFCGTYETEALEGLSTREAISYRLWKDPLDGSYYNLLPKIPGCTSKKLAPIKCTSENLLENIEAITHLSDEQVIHYLTQASVFVANRDKAQEKMVRAPIGAYYVWKEGNEIHILQKLGINAADALFDYVVHPEEMSLYEKLDKIASPSAMKIWRNKSQNKNYRFIDDESAMDYLINAKPGAYCFWPTPGGEFDYTCAFNAPAGFEYLYYGLNEEDDIWSLIESFTSRAFQISMLSKNDMFFSNKKTAIQTLENGLLGTIVIWKEKDGNLKALKKVSQVINTEDAITITLQENLFERLDDLKSMHVAPKKTSTQSKEIELLKLKEEFLKVLNPDISSEEIQTTTFSALFQLYKKKIRHCILTHSDEEQKDILAQKNLFCENAGSLLKENVDFSTSGTEKLDEIIASKSLS